jgi:ribonuclease R
MTQKVTDAAILRKIAQQPKATAGFKQLVRELSVRSSERAELSEQLERLVAQGQLLRVDADRFAIPKATGRNLIAGRLTMHRDGYGFVIVDAGQAEAVRQRVAGDIFIPPHQIGSAMHGDRVLAEVTALKFDGRAEGRIVRLLGRAHPTVVGRFHYGRRSNYVTPMDEKIAQDIFIPPGMERPSTQHSAVSIQRGRDPLERAASDAGGTPDRVLGEEAARRTEWDDLENVVVDVEITDWPSATQNPRGRVKEILGYADDFGVDVEIMIRKYHLPHRFPSEVLEEARAIPEEIAASELRRRRDYRELPIVTIDGETARDFDDAVLVRKLENGHWELQVHIADVAQYVRAGSALDGEARLRGTSVYFPDRAVPMLPLELSTNICSLRPKVERLVMSCVMEMDHHGDVVGYELHEGLIRSAERMTYTDVNLVLQGDGAAREKHAGLVGDFERMQELALILNRKREKRGSIDFDMPEPVIEFDEAGLMRGITRSERNIAHRIIEEFMLSANECVAEFLEQHGIASLYRIHEKPDAKRVYEFEVIAATWGYSLGVGALPIQKVQLKADRRAARGTGKNVREMEIPGEVKITPRMYQKLAEKIAGKPEERILSFLMLRSLKQARYSEENVGHFALATECYTHFTSPIRRYPDLIVHRILKEVLGKAELAGSAKSPWRGKARPGAGHARPAISADSPIATEELHEIAEESSQSERRADDAERELMEWKKVKFMQERIGEDFDGLIISVTKFGFFVELIDMFIEGLVPLATLVGDRFTFRENTRQIIGERTRKTYSLGDRVRVLVDRVDPVQHKLSFALVEEVAPARGKKRK